MSNSLKRGMVNVLIANLISLLFSLLSNFILPKYLSIDSYSAIKTYQLYVVYIGILHFGYEDGMYLKYGGKSLTELDEEDVANNLFTLRIFQILIAICAIIFALIVKDTIVLAFAIAIFPVNLIAYFKLMFQACGEFNLYGRVMNMTSIVIFAINAVFVFLFKTDNYNFYLIAYVMWNIILWLVLELYIRKIMPNCSINKKHFSLNVLKTNIKLGLPLTLGNFSSVLLTSIDRWFVKLFLDNLAFAQYSFAVSIESFINVAVTPITVTLYNYFCKHKDLLELKKIRNCVMIFASLIVSCGFGAKLIIEIFLQEYLGASNVLFILFTSQIFYIVIKGVYVNIYKAKRRQNKYFRKLIYVVFIGIFFNYLVFYFFKCMEAFATGTLISAIIWLLLCVRDFPELGFKWNEIIYLSIVTISFLTCGIFFNSILGFIIYIIILLFCTFVFLRKDFYYLIEVGRSFISLKCSFR